MSLKRKHALATELPSQKKKKHDFFSPRNIKDTTESKLDNTAFTFKDKAPDTTRLVTWNVNGIKSLDQKMLEKYLKAEDPSIMILTETRYSLGKPDIFCLKSRFKYQFWGVGSTRGGTAILSKVKPLRTTIGLPTWKNPTTNGHYVELEFEKLYIVGTYVPNAGESLQMLELKREWNMALMKRLRALDLVKPVIWAGDFNCIPTKKDIDKTAQGYWNKMGGMSTEERLDFDEILGLSNEDNPKFVDVWRYLHPTAEQYTHASKKYGAWRLDSFITSERILDQATHSEIRHELMDLNLSDHWPVMVDISTFLLV